MGKYRTRIQGSQRSFKRQEPETFVEAVKDRRQEKTLKAKEKLGGLEADRHKIP